MNSLLSAYKYLPLCLLVMFSSSTFSLGLGSISVDSALNEPLRATIELTGNDIPTNDQFLVNLADAETFSRMGADRPFYLTQIKFTPKLDTSPATIELHTQGPMNEPALNFIVEIQWPKGQMFKEYTILLNPK